MAENARRPYAFFMPGGFTLVVIGLVLATYAWTPPRSYNLAYFFVALLGFVLMFGGIVMAGWARALGARGRAARAPAARPVARAAEVAPTGPMLERVEVKCPRCATDFVAEGVRPIRLACPTCGHAGALPAPPVLTPLVRLRGLLRASARSAPPLPSRERVEAKCPRCDRAFGAEGVRPLRLTCPGCSHTAVLR